MQQRARTFLLQREMEIEPQDIVFQEQPAVTIGGNHFLCPTVIQWEDTPLLEVGKFETAGFTTKFAVYNSSGDALATVKGCQVYRTEAGKQSGIEMRHEPNLTACEVNGKTIFELRRTGAAALKGAAELYSPNGVFLKATDPELYGLLGTGGKLTAGPFTFVGTTFKAPIGILFHSGGISFAAFVFTRT